MNSSFTGWRILLWRYVVHVIIIVFRTRVDFMNVEDK